MVQGLKFLSKKGFHPKNVANQKRVWEREQERNQEASRMAERQKTLQRERDEEALRQSRGEVKLSFLYQAPPGMNEKKQGEDPDKSPAATATDMTQRQPGDDDAAAAFRALLAQGVPSAPEASSSGPSATESSSFGTTLRGANVDTALPDRKALSALEQAVGRKKTDAPSTTLEEQLERFPALKNAPRSVKTGNNNSNAVAAAVQFKPLGAQIRNVRCMTCGIWGHSRGDRECQVGGWDPFRVSTSQQPKQLANSTPATKPNPADRPGSDSNDSEDSSQDDRRRRKKKHRKRKSKKKSKRKSSSSSSSSLSSEENKKKKKRRRRSRSPDDRKRSRRR